MEEKAKAKNKNTTKASATPAAKVKDKAHIIIGIQAAIIFLFAITIALLAGQKPLVVTNFSECVDAPGSTVNEDSANTVGGKTCEVGDTKFFERDFSRGGDIIRENFWKNRKGRRDNATRLKAEEQSYIGLTEEQAEAKAKENNVPLRVVERDGKPLPMTMDLVNGRVNVTIKDGKVVSAQIENVEPISEE